ncbi:MAG: class I SAM-dependent methyltransferase [Pirellulales bacterium]|nr:class I SAM-dependent methyltransferase [Pirellulales bacterium]
MFERVLEAEVMDSAEEALAYDAMDHSAVNLAFSQDVLLACQQLAIGPAGDYLDLGTGTALIPIQFCQLAENTRVMAVDAATHMLDLARNNVSVAGLNERIRVANVDAKDLPFESASHDHVFSNSIVHHIPEPIDALREAWRVLAPGGLMFIRDLLRPSSAEACRQLVETYAGQETDYQQKLFADSLHAALTVDEMRELVAEFAAPPETVQATSDRHWTWAMQKPE